MHTFQRSVRLYLGWLGCPCLRRHAYHRPTPLPSQRELSEANAKPALICINERTPVHLLPCIMLFLSFYLLFFTFFYSCVHHSSSFFLYVPSFVFCSCTFTSSSLCQLKLYFSRLVSEALWPDGARSGAPHFARSAACSVRNICIFMNFSLVLAVQCFAVQALLNIKHT